MASILGIRKHKATSHFNSFFFFRFSPVSPVYPMEDPAPGTRHSPGSGWTLLLQSGFGNQRAAAAAWSQPIDVPWETAFPMTGWVWIPMNWDGLP